jgi:hypothetical protein
VLPFFSVFPLQSTPVADTSHISCPTCLRSLTPREVSFLLEEGEIEDYCGEALIMDTAFVNPSTASRRFSSLDNVLATRWFHITADPDWPTTVTAADVFVHVGVEDAAFDRMLSFVGTRHNPAQAAEALYLYELELAPDTRFARAIAVDTNEDYSDLRAGEQSHDAQRYLNRWESPGSISLVVSPHKLRVVGRRLVEPQEAYARDSIYNEDTAPLHEAIAAGMPLPTH